MSKRVRMGRRPHGRALTDGPAEPGCRLDAGRVAGIGVEIEAEPATDGGGQPGWQPELKLGCCVTANEQLCSAGRRDPYDSIAPVLDVEFKVADPARAGHRPDDGQYGGIELRAPGDSRRIKRR